MSDEPTLGEIGRRLTYFQEDVARQFTSSREDVAHKLSDVTEEIRLLRAELVRRDVYDANRITDQQRIFTIESQVKEVAERRRSHQLLLYSAVAVAVASFLFSLLQKLLFPH